MGIGLAFLFEHCHVQLERKQFRDRLKRAVAQEVLSQSDVDSWEHAVKMKKRISTASAESYVTKWTESEEQQRQSLLDKLNADSAVSARGERIEEGVEQISEQLEHVGAVLSNFERVCSGAALPDRPPGQSAVERIGIVHAEVRRLQTEGKNLKPEAAAERSAKYTEQTENIQAERASLKEQKTLLAQDIRVSKIIDRATLVAEKPKRATVVSTASASTASVAEVIASSDPEKAKKEATAAEGTEAEGAEAEEAEAAKLAKDEKKKAAKEAKDEEKKAAKEAKDEEKKAAKEAKEAEKVANSKLGKLNALIEATLAAEKTKAADSDAN
jgi:hypothetical protein